MRYIYLGDKLTPEHMRNMPCDPVRRSDGKCIVGKKPRNQLVIDQYGNVHVVLGRRLRLANDK